MRIILTTGKGGVGKTTLAAATAIGAAEAGHRVLVCSTDPAHSLGDVLDHPVGGDVVELTDRCSALELNTRSVVDSEWSAVTRYILDVLAWAEIDGVRADELAMIPGVDEIVALSQLCHAAQTGRHDVIVVDCAPSAETLRLLSFPHVMSGVATAAGLDAGPGGLVRQLVGSALKVPLPDRQVLEALDRLDRDLEGLSFLLEQGADTTARIVLTPERVVLRESLRTHAYLSLFGIPVDAVVVNRVAEERPRRNELMDTISSSFGKIPILTAPLCDDEPLGETDLRGLADRVFCGDPSTVLHDEEMLDVVERGTHRVLRFPVADTARADIDVKRVADTLDVRIGRHRRQVTLPASLAGRPTVAAGLCGDKLEVELGEIR